MFCCKNAQIWDPGVHHDETQKWSQNIDWFFVSDDPDILTRIVGGGRQVITASMAGGGGAEISMTLLYWPCQQAQNMSEDIIIWA